jgi:hypothetical protein
MKAHLLYPDRDFDWIAPPLWNEAELTADLAVGALLDAMSAGDQRVRNAGRRVLFDSVNNDASVIGYRQGVLEDCLGNPSLVRDLYAMTLEIEKIEGRSRFSSPVRYAEWALSSSVDLMAVFIGFLGRLRRIADRNARHFLSPGWRALFATLRQELDDEFFERARRHLAELKTHRGMKLSASLGAANTATRYILHDPLRWDEPGWWSRLIGWLLRRRPPANSFDIHPLDESGIRALNELRKQGLVVAAEALGKATDHVFAFFAMLREELAFYVGCLNLSDDLARCGAPRCMPRIPPATERRLSFRGLYDVSLALTIGAKVVGNDVTGDGRNPVIVTGANQGGKSTFLRSIGLAQLMAQAGMFAPARSFSSSLCDGIFTHYKREEDAALEAGKLDEELRRMSDIVDHLTPRPLILFNESFSSTNEREGAELAWQIMSALLESEVRIVLVTHLYELARRFHNSGDPAVLCLRAERKDDGARTFRILEGEPLETSFGQDLYTALFETDEPAPLNADSPPARDHATSSG